MLKARIKNNQKQLKIKEKTFVCNLKKKKKKKSIRSNKER